MPTTKDMYSCIEAERARKGWTIEEFSGPYSIIRTEKGEKD